MGAIFRVHLLHNMMHMRFDGFGADRELLGDGAIGQAINNEPQNVAFAAGQRCYLRRWDD